MKHIRKHSLAAIAALLPLGAAHAAVVNGSFESGLAGWSTLGDASAQAAVGSVGAPHGAAQLALTTASSLFDDDLAGVGAFNLSGTDTALAGGSLEAFVGLTPGGLDPDPANAVQAFEGSAVLQTFTASAGETLSFRFNFLSNDTLPGDYGFIVIDGVLFKLADATWLSAPAGSWSQQSGHGVFNHVFASAGTHLLAFGVVDVGDFSASSALLVDAVQVSAVPEPQTYALMLIGLAAMGAAARRRR